MVFEFKFPDVGEGITEGDLVKWLVKEGDRIEQDKPIAKIETDKAVVEIPSPKAGTILKLHHKEGDVVKVGETLVTIGEAEEKTVEEPEKPTKQDKTKKKKDTGSVVGDLGSTVEEIPAPPTNPESTPENAHVLATPAVRRLARDMHIDLSKIKGSGKDSRITEEDVRRYAKAGGREESKAVNVSKRYDIYGHVERIPFKGIRKATAKNMVQSAYTAPHVVHMDNADVTDLWDLRAKEKEAAAKKKTHLTFLPFIIKACIAAFKDHPYLNATLDDEHEEILLKKYYNIGVAVDSEGGLLVPVVKNAQDKSILEIAKEIEKLSEKVRSREIALEDMKGGTFTITNIGSLGGVYATPIINYPEVAILATGAIRESPVVKNSKVVVRKILPLSLAFDHRVLDGAEAARFMNDLIKYLEDPQLLLIE